MTLNFPSSHSLEVKNRMFSSLDSKEINYSDEVIEISSLLQKDLEPLSELLEFSDEQIKTLGIFKG